MNAVTPIAQHLNIAEAAIVRIEEWASVLFVVCKRLGARFVSKKVIQEKKQMQLTEHETVVTDGTFAVYYGVEGSRYGNVLFSADKFGLKSNTGGGELYSFDKQWDDTVKGELREQLLEFDRKAKQFFDTETKRIEAERFAQYLKDTSKPDTSIDLEYEMYSPNGKYYG